MDSKITIRPETEADIPNITKVTISAFETLEISDKKEQFIIKALRKAGALTISLVAQLKKDEQHDHNDGEIVGHIAFSPISISNETKDWYGLAPVSVLPKYQKQGIGKALIWEGLSRLKEMKAKGCCLVGHPEYYKKFGFRNVSGLVYEGVPEEYFFALVLGEGEGEGVMPQGTVTFHEAFGADGK